MPDLPTRLARKWCRGCAAIQPPLPSEHQCVQIAAAIREALEEAEKVARQFGPTNYPTEVWPDEVEGSLDRAGAKMARITSENIAATLAALREGRG